MIFKSDAVCVFLKSDSGIFVNDDGQPFHWYKVVFADPETFENHELAYRDHVDFSRIKKGQKLSLILELEPTSKKSRVVVTDFEVID